MNNLLKQVRESVGFIKKKTKIIPDWAIILGTGLGKLSENIKAEEKIPYENIPHFVKSTAISHKGQLILGKIKNTPVVVMDGRFHHYEGYSMNEITYPVRVAKMLGAKGLIASNAAGGLNSMYRKGDIVLIDDHINLLPDNPLRGPNFDELGDRFPDMSEPYAQEFITTAEKIARKLDIRIHRGVYAALSGPNLETRAEYRFLRSIGADLVGMSTVPEVLVAVHSHLKVLGVSIVTDLCFPDSLKPISVKEIIAVAQTAEPNLAKLIEEFIVKTNI